MIYIPRLIESQLTEMLKDEKSILLLGPRQTGKTTLLKHIPADKRISLADLRERLRYEKTPALLANEVEALSTINKKKLPLVIIDEIQKVPLLMDAIQDLIDRRIAKFIITGSSARKLRRRNEMNLLPGRVIPLRLDPLMHVELAAIHPPISLNTLLLDGSLPAIVLQKTLAEKETLLDAYVAIYLEEEIRAEALVRELGYFARFLELAASESGKIVNFSKLSQEIGVTHSTIAGYYQILEDCLIAERVEPVTESKTRRRLSKTQKYIFYDLGVRRIAAHEGTRLPKEQMGYLFEQYIGLELIRNIRAKQKRHLVKYWRDTAGPEVDWVVQTEEEFIPIEVKWTESPTSQDAKYLELFLKEYPEAKQGFIVCRTPHAMKISNRVSALPWQQLLKIL